MFKNMWARLHRRQPKQTVSESPVVEAEVEQVARVETNVTAEQEWEAPIAEQPDEQPSALTLLPGRSLTARDQLTPNTELVIWGYDRTGQVVVHPGTYACIAQPLYGTISYLHLVRWEDREAAMLHQRPVEQFVLSDTSSLRLVGSASTQTLTTGSRSAKKSRRKSEK